MTERVKMTQAVVNEFKQMKAEYQEDTLFNTMRSIKFDDDDFLNLRAWLNEDHVHQLEFATLFGADNLEELIVIEPPANHGDDNFDSQLIAVLESIDQALRTGAIYVVDI